MRILTIILLLQSAIAAWLLVGLDAADRRHTEDVAQDTDYHVSAGHISDAEMSRLQPDIARLPDPERRRMLAKLVGALNSGQLEGRL